MKVLVVGGGTAGLVTALILKRKLDVEVDIVRSKEIGTVGVGEGSTEHFATFLKTIGLDQYHFIRNTNATLKIGIKFENWNPERTYLHSIGKEYDELAGQYPYLYGKEISSNNSKSLCSELNWNDKVNRWFSNQREEWPTNQFHFNTHMMNDYLSFVANQMGIKIYDDEISDVILKEGGQIGRVKGKERDYKYDFYVDATGFKRMLIGRVGAEWKSFGEYMKMNSAITFQTEHEDDENISMTTLARGMDYGWMFRLPTWDHVGNGYIYDNNYIGEDEAKREVEDYLGREITIGKTFSFDPGYLKNSWTNNCVAVGLAAAFVEPLEATSIGTTIQQAFLISHRLSNYDQLSIDSYNKSFTNIMENIRDFICLHYVTPRRDTQFWKDVSKMPLPESLSEKMKRWKNHLPISEDFCGDSDYTLFNANNYTIVLEGLDLFDRNSIRKEYMNQSPIVRNAADELSLNQKRFIESIATISHRSHIQMIRDVFA
jgi:flavin-dependent dehydrogenase